MADSPDVIVIEPQGAVRVPGPNAQRRLKEHAGHYQLVVDVPGLLVLRRTEEGGPPLGARVLMSGEMVTRMTVMEIINIIAQANWRGDLHVFGPDSHRSLGFDQGALKQARSDVPDDRLGEVMFRNGVLTRAQLDALMQELTPDLRLGELCVQKGICDSKKLFEQLQRQAENIFFAALLVSEGHYAFVLPDDTMPEESYATTIHVPIHGLLMEGVQRVDEMALFRDKIPNNQMSPTRVAGAQERKLDANARVVLAACDGRRTIDDIARETGLGEFLTTKAVYHLLQSKLVTLRSGPSIDSNVVRRLVGKFNDVLQDIFLAVATYGGLAQTRATLDAWIIGSGYAPYFGESVDDFGCIDPEHVVAAMERLEHDRPLEGLHQALHELAAFALFSATTALPRDQELSLARDVNARLKAIRIE